MTLTDLQAQLNDRTGPDGLPLTPALGPEVGSLLAALALPSLRVAAPAISRSNGTLTVTGTADLLGARGAGITLTAEGADAPQLSLRLTLPPHWGFADGFPALPPSFKADPTHGTLVSLQPSLLYDLPLDEPVLEVGPTGGAPPAVRFSATSELPPAYARLSGRLGLGGSVPVHGTLRPGASGSAALDLRLGTEGALLAIGSLHVRDVALRLRTAAGGTGDALTVLSCEGRVRIGETDPVEVTVAADYEGDEDYYAFSARFAARALTLSRGVDALAELVGAPAADFSLPPGMEPLESLFLSELDVDLDARHQLVRAVGVRVACDRTWTLVEGLRVTDLSLGWRVLFPFAASREFAVGLAGTLELGTDRPVRFDVGASVSGGWMVEGALRDGDAIELTELVERALGFRAELPRFAIDRLRVQAARGGDFLLDGSVASDWQVEVEHQRFTLQRVTFLLQSQASSRTGRLFARADVAGTPLFVQATLTSAKNGQSGVEFEGGTLPGGEPIHLTAVVAWALDFFGVTLPAGVPDVTLRNLDVRFNTLTKEFHFEGETDVPIEVPFLAGDANRAHAAVNLTSTVNAATGKRTLSGFMEADVAIGTSVFTVRYALGAASHVFTASWEATAKGGYLGLNTLLGAIGAGHDVQIPDAVDLNLRRVYFEYQAELHSLTLVADSASYGEAFLTAMKPLAADGTPGSWQFAFGVQYPGTLKLSDVPGLGGHMGAADIFHFEELAVLIASADFASWTPPALPPLRAPTDTADPPARTPVAAGSTFPLKKGISFLGIIDLEASESGGDLAALRTVLPDPKLTITAAYDAGAENFSLRAALQGSIDIPTGGTSDLRIGNASLELDFPNPIAFKIRGELALTFDHEVIDVEPQITVSAEGVELSVPISFPNGWKSPMGIQGLTLDEVAFAMGVNFLPAPGVNLGLSGAAHVGTEAPKSDQFAFVLEIIEEVPDPLLLSFALEELSVEEALRLFAPSAEHVGLPDFVKQIRVTEVSFFWAESIVVMPDGTVARPGLRFRGNVQVLNFAAHAAVSIDSSGMMGEVMMGPIHFGHVASITGGGEGVYRNERDGKPVPLTALPEKSPAPVERVQLVPPGGPVVRLRTSQSPWLYASIHVTLFDALSEEIEALVSEQGVHFKLAYAITDAVKAELDCTVDRSGLAAHAEFGLHLKADLGPIRIAGIDFGTIHLDAGFDLAMTLEASAERFLLELTGDFEFEGARLTFPTLRIEAAPASLAELPERLIRHLGENLEEVFADLFAEAGRLVEAAAKEVARLAEEAAAEVAKLEKAAIEEAARLEKEAEEAVERAAHEVAAEAERVAAEAKRIAEAAAAEVQAVAKAAEAEAERIAGEIAKAAEAAEHEVEAIGQEIAREAREVEQAVEKLAADALHEAEQIAHAVEAEAQQILAVARQVGEELIRGAQQVVNALANEAQALWNEAKHLAEAAAEAFRQAARAVEHAAESAVNWVKSY